MNPIHFLPSEAYVKEGDKYECPCYKTANREGKLSTTGLSTNYIIAVDIPSLHHNPSKWVESGVALICAISD